MRPYLVTRTENAMPESAAMIPLRLIVPSDKPQLRNQEAKMNNNMLTCLLRRALVTNSNHRYDSFDWIILV